MKLFVKHKDTGRQREAVYRQLSALELWLSIPQLLGFATLNSTTKAVRAQDLLCLYSGPGVRAQVEQ